MTQAPLVSQDTMTPTRKVTTYTLGGACAAIFAWLLGELAAVQMPPGIEAAFALIAGFILSYFVRDRANT